MTTDSKQWRAAWKFHGGAIPDQFWWPQQALETLSTLAPPDHDLKPLGHWIGVNALFVAGMLDAAKAGPPEPAFVNAVEQVKSRTDELIDLIATAGTRVFGAVARATWDRGASPSFFPAELTRNLRMFSDALDAVAKSRRVEAKRPSTTILWREFVEQACQELPKYEISPTQNALMEVVRGAYESQRLPCTDPRRIVRNAIRSRRT